MLAGITRDRIVFATDAGDLAAVPADPDTLEPRGAPVVVTQGLAQLIGFGRRSGFVAASLAESGVLAYRAGTDPHTEFVWMDRSGRRLGLLGEPGPWHNFDLSRDGRLVIAATRRRGVSSTLFLLDTLRGVTSAVLDGPEPASDPTWSPDGRRIAYRIRNTLVARAAQGGSETILRSEAVFPDSWSHDGRFIAFGGARQDHYDLFAIDVETPKREPVLLATGNPVADEPRFSPSGRWLGYQASTQTGADQIYVIPFPPTGERWQVSSDGGVPPRWSPSGRRALLSGSWWPADVGAARWPRSAPGRRAAAAVRNRVAALPELRPVRRRSG
jgi:Tol biopolymer transport system component